MEFLLNLNLFAISQIILIDILLGGDNAILIALACRNLPAHLRFKGILWGMAGAVVIRIVLVAFTVTLMQMPYLKIVGGLLLFWIGIKLMAETEESHGDVHASDRLLSAIKTILIADIVMSVDNVLAVASVAQQAAGEHQLVLVVFGIMVSVPIIVWGSTLVLKLMDRFPWVITLGAALLGYLGGSMLIGDVVLAPWIQAHWPASMWHVPGLDWTINLPGLIGAVGVVLAGHLIAKKHIK